MSKANRSKQEHCTICGKLFDLGDLVVGDIIRPAVVEQIRQAHPDWSDADRICHEDLAAFRGQYVHSLLESEKGELTSLEQEVIRSLREHELLSSNVDAELDEDRTAGERLADRIATFGGSWTFLILFAGFLSIWILINSLVLLWKPLDPYPYILLNLVLSCLASVQAPIIIMSQNRQAVKDRLRSQHDYQVNLKAELEIRQLHEKVDHLLLHQWERMVKIQEVQLELLAELGKKS